MEPKVNQLEYAKGLLKFIEHHSYEALEGSPKLISIRLTFIQDSARTAILAIEKHQEESK